MCTFDSIEELQKLKDHHPQMKCVLRIATKATCTNAIYNLSEKYGALEDEIKEILLKAKELEMNVPGVSFHVGSGGVVFDAYKNSLYDAKKVFEIAEEIGMQKMSLVDIGGGFSYVVPGTGGNFNEVAP